MPKKGSLLSLQMNTTCSRFASKVKVKACFNLHNLFEHGLIIFLKKSSCKMIKLQRFLRLQFWIASMVISSVVCSLKISYDILRYFTIFHYQVTLSSISVPTKIRSLPRQIYRDVLAFIGVTIFRSRYFTIFSDIFDNHQYTCLGGGDLSMIASC